MRRKRKENRAVIFLCWRSKRRIRCRITQLFEVCCFDLWTKANRVNRVLSRIIYHLVFISPSFPPLPTTPLIPSHLSKDKFHSSPTPTPVVFPHPSVGGTSFSIPLFFRWGRTEKKGKEKQINFDSVRSVVIRGKGAGGWGLQVQSGWGPCGNIIQVIALSKIE